MKKVLVIVSIVIAFILVYLIQTNFFNWFTIAGIKPNLFIILILFLGLFLGEVYGAVTGALMGMLLDLFVGKVIRSKWYCTDYSRFPWGQAE